MSGDRRREDFLHDAVTEFLVHALDDASFILLYLKDEKTQVISTEDPESIAGIFEAAAKQIRGRADILKQDNRWVIVKPRTEQ